MLKPYPSVKSLLAILDDSSSKAALQKDILTQTLLAEHKTRPHPFWTAVLTVAYAPMLLRLRSRIRGDAFGSDDLDQIVINTFLDVVQRFPIQLRTRTYLQLRQMTQRQVFKALRDEQQWRKQQHRLSELAKLIDGFDPFQDTSVPDSIVEQEDLAHLLLEVADGMDRPENLDLIIATVIKREKLGHYIERIGGYQEESNRQRVYERFKRKRTRVLQRLRPVLNDLACPRPDEPGLCAGDGV